MDREPPASTRRRGRSIARRASPDSFPRQRSLFLPLLALVAAGLVSPGRARAQAAIDWPQVERLEKADEPAAALALIESAAMAEGGERDLLRARTRHRLLHRLGRFDEAQQAGREWISLALDSSNVAEQRRAYHQTGRSLAAAGRNREAVALFRAGMERTDTGTAAGVDGDLALDLSSALVILAEYPEAQALLDQVEQALDPQELTLRYKLWQVRGTALAAIGDLRRALDYRRRALDAAESLGEDWRVATAAVNLGQSAMLVHDYARALALFDRALALEPWTQLQAIAMTSSGICHFELNQLEPARDALERARRLARDDGSRDLEAWTEGELGLVALKQERPDEALELFDRAIAITRQLHDLRNEAVWWSNKGRVRRDQKRWQEALVFYRQALEIEARIAGQQPQANLRKHMAQCYAGLGDDESAARLFDEAARLAEAAGDEKVLWETQLEIARLHRRNGDLIAAGRAYERSLEGIESLRGSLQLESFKTDFFEDKVKVYTEAVTFFAAKDGLRSPERAFEAAERSRARAFLDSLVEARAEVEETLPQSVLDEERALLAEISRLQAALRQAESTPDLRRALDEKERELERFHLDVRSRFPRFRDLRYPQPVTVGEVQESLGDGVVLLEYLLAEPVSHLWIVRSQEVVHRELPGAPEIEEAVRDAYGALLSPDLELRGDRLAELLLVSFALSPAPASLLIVPSGILHYFPFETLPVGGGRLLGEIASTSYLPSASVLVELQRRSRATLAPRLLALGDVEYGGEPSSTRLALLPRPEELGSLPHTRSEVTRVCRLFGRRSSTALLDQQATEARLKQADLASYSVLHLATHGFIDASSPSRSGLVLGVSEGDGEDGILQFHEVLRLPLAAELVTLSACKSALGELVTGEGMVGLARSFFYAGADGVVASLWNVDDEATAVFMEAFYRRLREGATTAEALRRARLETRERPAYADPYYWAPYVLLGRGGDGVSFPPRRRSALGVLLGATLLLVTLMTVVARLSLRRRSDPTPTGPPTRNRP